MSIGQPMNFHWIQHVFRYFGNKYGRRLSVLVSVELLYNKTMFSAAMLLVKLPYLIAK